MTWGWSHTPEAYRDAELNLRDMPVDELRIIWAEWQADKPRPDPDYPGDMETGFCSDAYDAALRSCAAMAHDTLADDIWRMASELRLCTNGGHQAYMCPYGCEPHLVAFDIDPERRGNEYC